VQTAQVDQMLDFISRLFGDRNEKETKKLKPIVDEINRYAEEYKSLSEDELKGKTAEFKARIAEATAQIVERKVEILATLKGGRSQDTSENGQEIPQTELTIDDRHRLSDELDDLEEEWNDVVEAVLDEILPEAFAVVKETSRRMIGREWTAGGSTIRWDMVPYDVQMIGGIVLHQGRIAEMKTGEGKTLVAVAPVYLNALAGRGVHLVTVNPYLAQRDAEWMGPVFEYHGMTVDVIDKYEPHTEGRRKAYNADITYGTNNEFGFDYLRDNSFVVDSDQLVQRHHHFAIVDEVDSVLVDEARTPLIISGPVPQSNDDRFAELKSSIEKVVSAQQRLVAGFVSEAEKLLKQRDEALAAGDKRKANDFETDAGLAILRAQRGFPRNKKLQKLLQEPGIGQLLRQTEYYYLQDNAKNMPFVDEALHFALDEKQHAIEMTDTGREFAARTAGEDVDLFVLPDLGDEIAKMEANAARELREFEETVGSDENLSEEKRQHKIENEQHVSKNRIEDKKRELYTKYSERAERLHAIEQLLRAYTLYEKDTEYIVQEGRVQIVDQHTGRVLSGRRYSDGLHQAIEAKENVKVQSATQTYATITLQNYFRMYHKLAGMTGTAETESEEFHKIYGMDVVVIPTNRPIARGDLDDLVFKTRREKYNAVLMKIEEYYKKGQPVLVGTTSVEVSETLSRMLTRTGIRHNVLNAKRDRAKQESLIVSEAGQKSAVTIATNMAGRGTDIKLGEGVREIGGLAILGTERHESRRIDLQLRGRAGRQGDPGESQFYVSLEDELMRLFGSDRVSKVMDRLNLEEGAVITHPWVNKSIERAQKKVEQNNFAIRKRQLEYDDVLNAQRQVIYDRRRHALIGERFRGEVLDMLRDVVKNIVERHYGDGNLEEMREEVLRTLAFDFEMDRETFVRLGDDGVMDHVFEKAVEYYIRKRDALATPFRDGMKRLMDSDREDKPERVYVDFSDGRKMLRAVVRVEEAVDSNGQAVNDAIERSAMLSIIDEKWTEHLRELDTVKEGIGLRAYGQRDPLVEYKMEAFKLFAEMMGEISNEVVSFVFRAGPLVDAPARQATQQKRRLDPNRAQAQHDSMEPSYGVNSGRQNAADRDPTAKQQPVVIEDTVGRNDPCPCGSGKKYKHCHGRA
jgi:preprotein translocase subunit SecA